MTDVKKIGVVIADKDEYVHIEALLGEALALNERGGFVAHSALLSTANKKAEIITICSGIGKVNAAIAATVIAPDCDIIVNAGLSGGFGDAKKYDLVVGTKFFEHDFDLTAIGYRPSQKPGQSDALCSDEALVRDIVTKYPFVKSGVFVTGDSFICEKEKHDMLAETFNPIACDMESAAVAEVAARFKKPYVSLRMVSDGADDDSAATYSDTLKCSRASAWCSLLFNWIKSM